MAFDLSDIFAFASGVEFRVLACFDKFSLISGEAQRAFAISDTFAFASGVDALAFAFSDKIALISGEAI